MIELENRGPVTILRMARGKGNALNLELVTALGEALDALDRGLTGAVVITGQGSVFGAGVDLLELLEGGESYARQFIPCMIAAFRRLATYPKPVVAAVNGHAIAGGAIIVFACDQRIMAEGNVRIGLSEIQVGVMFPAWALEVARFATPGEHFSTLICTGRTWQPADALARGLVDELVGPERLLERAVEVAGEMAAVPAATFAGTKLAVRRPMIEAAERCSAADGAVIDYWCAPETLAQIKVFADRNIRRKG